MAQQQLFFSSEIGGQKPDTIRHKSTACPFCKTEELTDILEQDGSTIWLMNKYPTLIGTYQTVIIETDECASDMRYYEPAHMRRLIKFSLQKWFEVEASGSYESVIMFKNHGPFSGGSLVHPHMQIVGLSNVDYLSALDPSNFDGPVVYERNGVSLGVSAFPIAGFTEYNLSMPEDGSTDTFADMLQVLIRHVLSLFDGACNSFNLFFYHVGNRVVCKVVPRFVTSPLFIGYKIPQVLADSDLDRAIERLANLFANYSWPE